MNFLLYGNALVLLAKPGEEDGDGDAGEVKGEVAHEGPPFGDKGRDEHDRSEDDGGDEDAGAEDGADADTLGDARVRPTSLPASTSRPGGKPAASPA